MDRLERVDCTKCGRSVYAVPGYVDPLCTQCGREKYNVPAHVAGLPRSSVTLGPRTGRVHEDDRQCGPDYRGWFAFCRRCMKRWPADSADQVADVMRVHDHVVHNPHGWIGRTKLRPASLIQRRRLATPGAG